MAAGTTRTRNGAAEKRPRSSSPKPKAKAVVLPNLPPVGIARFQEATRLIESLVEEKTDVFLQAMNRFQDRKRDTTSRGLSHVEAAQVAAALSEQLDEPPLDFAVEVQKSDLRASDPASSQELLLAAGLSTAPEFVDAALKFVALIEMPADAFKAARKDGTLRTQIDADADAIIESDLPLPDIRARAAAALGHLATEGGEEPGKAVGLVRDLVSQALAFAMTEAAPDRSGPLPLTVSPPPTAGTST